MIQVAHAPAAAQICQVWAPSAATDEIEAQQVAPYFQPPCSKSRKEEATETRMIRVFHLIAKMVNR